jgi:murein DD-endopeptidase MepM/ murein hydrolase activator NlpD
MGGDDRSFDPGLETGYLRRAPRDHELDPELGSAPFDPGPGHYDERRARKQEKQRQREEERLQRLRDAGASPAGPRLADSDSLSGRDEPPSPTEVATPPEAEVVELRPRRESVAERLERERIARERAERKRRAKVELERAARERAEQERREHRRRERAEKLRRERESLRPSRRRAAMPPSGPAAARIDPSVRGPVRRRARAAENRQRVAARRRGLFWPTAKAGLAITLVVGLGGALGTVLGLPLPGLDQTTGNTSLANSASIFGIDPGTPTGLVHGYVFPILGPHDFGEKDARFGASRYGHVHEGQDIFAKPGTPEVAVHDGVIVDRGTENGRYSGGRGNYIAIYSPADDRSFVYMHMLKPPPVQIGEQVHSGQVVGQLGCTGSCDGPHLHFEVRIDKASLRSETKPIDPLPFLKEWPQSTPG